MGIEQNKYSPDQAESFTRALDERIASRTEIKFGNGSVQLMDVTPTDADLDTGARIKEVPTVISPAWNVRPDVYSLNVEALIKDGRRVISVDAPHGIPAPKPEHELAADLPAAQLRRVEALIQSLDALKVGKTDAVGHSEGGLVVVLAAVLRPEKFRNLVLVDSAGLIGRDTVMDLAKRTVEFARDEADYKAKKETLDRTTGDQIKDILARPDRSLLEILSMAKADVRPLLRYLKEKGVGVSVIHAVDDKLFPSSRLQLKRLSGESESAFEKRFSRMGELNAVIEPKGESESLKEYEQRGQVAVAAQKGAMGAENIASNISVDMVDGVYTTYGGHNQVILDPQEYSPVIKYALNAAETKSEKLDSAQQ